MGNIDEVKGRVKEALGALTDDDKLKRKVASTEQKVGPKTQSTRLRTKRRARVRCVCQVRCLDSGGPRTRPQ